MFLHDLEKQALIAPKNKIKANQFEISFFLKKLAKNKISFCFSKCDITKKSNSLIPRLKNIK
jgi:hypothetical protein